MALHTAAVLWYPHLDMAGLPWPKAAMIRMLRCRDFSEFGSNSAPMPRTPAVRRLRPQDDHKFEVSLSYILI